MRIFLLLMSISILLSDQTDPTASPTPQATQPALVILLAPLPGQALQGVILITGNTAVNGFSTYELSFGYTNDLTGTWFLINRSSSPVENGLLAHWDTTTITDGDYNMQLVVNYTDGSQVTLTVPGLRVRNYSTIETNTPTPLPPTATLAPGTPLPPTNTPTITPTPSITPIPPTPSPLPTNPAILSQADITGTIGKGVGVGISLFILLGAYLGIRQQLRHRS